MSIIRTYLFLGLIFLCGCAATTSNIPKDFSFNNDANGVVALSVVNKFQRYNPKQTGVFYGLNIVVEDIETGEKIAIRPAPGLMTPKKHMLLSQSEMVHRRNPYGVLEIKELPAGHYRVYAPQPIRESLQFERPEQSFEFNVTPNEITYLGEFGVNVKYRDVGLEFPPQIYIRSAERRDTMVLKHLYSNLRGVNINNANISLDPMNYPAKSETKILFIPTFK